MRSGAAMSLYRGVVVLPRLRLQWTAIDGPPLLALGLGLPPLLLLLSRRFSAAVVSRQEVWTLAAIEAGIVGWSAFSLPLTALLWNMVRMSAPMMVVAAAILATSHADAPLSPKARERLFLVAAVAGWCALIQFPVDSYQYFLYVLPLFILAAAAIAVARETPAKHLAVATLLAFGVLGLLMRPVFIHGGGSHVVLTGDATALLDLERGGLTIRRAERDEYVALAAVIRQHSRSPYIYASPDAPEAYFLSERENPTRTLFDFFDESTGRSARILEAIRDQKVDVIVINKTPRFSQPLPSELRDSLIARFPNAVDLRLFQVRW